jgi:outer membrane receptor protein involved in Fe transport
MQKLLKVLGLTLLLLSFAVTAFGQTETGQITGTVKDKSGAVVPNAKVTLVAVETNTTRTAITSAAGLYNFPSLKPAVYKVTVEAAGFERFERQVTVNVASNVDVSAQLLVGSSTTVVEVTATSADIAVNTENQTISTVINTGELEQLPTDPNRNPYALVGMSSNATLDSNSNRGAGFALNGERSASTSILLDGAENVDAFLAGVGQQVPLDSVQEFSVLTSNFGAEFGRASGGVVNLVTKSGTNHLHGSAYEFNRISALSANTYYNDANSVAKSVFTRNNFGFSVGGPIIKNKLFFFENLEWIRVRSAGQNEAAIIDPASYSLLGADSAAFMTQYGSKLATGVTTKATGPCNTPGNPGVGITCDLVNYTAPTDAGGGAPQNTWDNVSKIDWNISAKTTLSGRYAAYKELDEAGYINNSPYAGYNTGQTSHNQNLAFTLTHIFTPNIVGTSKLIYNRLLNIQPLGTNPVSPTMYTTPTGIPSVPTAGLQQPLIFPGYSEFTPGNAIPFGGPQNLYQIYQDFSVTKGRHQIKFGGQFIQLRDNRIFGAYENAVEALGSTYNTALANLLTGNLYEFQGAVNPEGEYPCVKNLAGVYQVTPACTLTLPISEPKFSRNYKYNDGAFYGQDAWKVSSRLTLNAGLRWEYYGVQHNSDPNLDSNFVLGPGATQFDQIRNGAVELAKNGGVFWKPSYGNFGPRVGFAWDPTGKGKMSLRGGYSIGYERNFGNVTFNAIQNPPNYATLAIIAGTDVPSMPVYTDNAGPLAGTGSKAFAFSVSQRAINQNIKTAYAETWNLGIEQALFTNAIFTVSYAGSRGIHEYDIANVNLGGAGGNYLGDAHASNRLNLQYGAMNYRSDAGFNRYNALLVGFKANNMAKTGVSINANYQWSHALDNLSSTFTDGIPANYGTGYLDAFNPKVGYGNADYDVRHRFVASASWEIPWMKNASNTFERLALGGWAMSGIFNARTGMPFSIYDGDGFNGSVYPLYAPGTGHKIATSGTPVNAGGGFFNYINIPINPSDPNGQVYGAGNSLGLPACTGLYHVGCTYTADGSTYPDRNQFKGPNFWNADMQFMKNFKFGEKLAMQFRAEMYNIFNHHNQYTYAYGLDVSGMATGANSIQTAKGAISGVPGSPNDEHRNVDLGLKITF